MKTIETTQKPAAGTKATKTKPVTRSAPKPPTRKPVKTTIEIPTGILLAAVKIARGTGETFDELVSRAIRNLANHSANRDRERLQAIAEFTTIPAEELHAMLLQKAMDAVQPALEAGGLTLPLVLSIADEDREGLLPVYLPADDVRILREVCEAGGIETGDDFARGMIASLIEHTLESDMARGKSGACGLLDAAAMEFDENPDPEVMERMQSVVDKWNASKIGGAA